MERLDHMFLPVQYITIGDITMPSRLQCIWLINDCGTGIGLSLSSMVYLIRFYEIALKFLLRPLGVHYFV